MSVQIIIRCDGTPGGPKTRCYESAGGWLPWHKTATKIRAALRHRPEAWHRTDDGRDIGPKCWADGCHKPGVISPTWCAECSDRKPCVCDDDPMPLAGEDWDDLDDDGGAP